MIDYTVETLDFSNQRLTELPDLLPYTNLKRLICYNIQLTALPPLPDSLQILNCSENALITLPPLPASLQQLVCSWNKLTALPPLPASLQELKCSYNQLTELPPLPSSLTYLRCENDKLTALPPLPASLNHFNCSDNRLTELPPLPASLEELYCSVNLLTELPPLPASLQDLYCNKNKLTTLPPLPASLSRLDCSVNQLTELPPLPASLSRLDCSNNQLTELPPHDTRLRVIWNNNPGYTSIRTLNADMSPFSLPTLPASIRTLNADMSPLTYLPPLPASLRLSMNNPRNTEEEEEEKQIPPVPLLPSSVPLLPSSPMNHIPLDKQTLLHDVIEGEIPLLPFMEEDPEHLAFLVSNQWYGFPRKQLIPLLDLSTPNNAIVYECRTAGTLRPENIERNICLFQLRKIGLFLGYAIAGQLAELIADTSIRYVQVVESGKQVVSVVSDTVLNHHGSYVSASHCQEGQGGKIYTIERIEPTMVGGMKRTRQQRQRKRTLKQRTLKQRQRTLKQRKQRKRHRTLKQRKRHRTRKQRKRTHNRKN